MNPIQVGTVCYKTRGREAGKKVVIVGFDKETGMAVVSGERARTRKCNLLHLWPTKETVDVKEFREKLIEPKEKRVLEKKEKKKSKRENKKKEKKGT